MQVAKKIDGRKTKPFEKMVDIIAIVSFENTGGQDVGAILLESKGRLILRFGFQSAGIHNDITYSQAEAVVSQLRILCSELPIGESIIFESSSFPEYQTRQQELESILALDDSNPLNVLTKLELQELKENSTRISDRPRLVREITIWPAVSSQHLGEKLDFLGNLIKNCHGLIKTWSGEAAEEQQLFASRFLVNSWRSYLRWSQVFQEHLSDLHQPQILAAEQIWEKCWNHHNRFKQQEIPPIPNLLRVNVQTGSISQEIGNVDHKSCRSVLGSQPHAFPTGNGYQSIFVDGKYITAVSIDSQVASWNNELDQLNWLANGLSKSPDTRCVAEIWVGQQEAINNKLRNFTSESIKNIAYHNRKASSPVIDEEQVAQATEAERSMLQGMVAIEFGLSFFFYNDIEKAAFDAAYSMVSSFSDKAFRIELAIVQELWFQSLPHTVARLLTGAVPRTIHTDSKCLPAYLPLGVPVSIANQGLEMRAKWGHTPIYLDLNRFRGHIQIFGLSREASKSVLAANIKASAMAQGRYVTTIDIPQNAKAASFPYFTKYIAHGDYLDIISRDNYNFFETVTIPAGTDPDLRHEIIKETINLVRLILLTATLGADLHDPAVSTSSVDAMLVQLLGKFFAAPEIKNRYTEAKDPAKGGLGSEAWNEMPTVKDFIDDYLSIEHLDIKGRSSSDEMVIGFIKGKLIAWFTADNCKAPNLAKPSTININSRMLTIALRKFADNNDAAVYGLVAQGLAYRRAIKFMPQGTLTFNDENAIALQHKSLAMGLGALFANLLKANGIMMLAQQPPDTITQSAAAGMIKANIRYTFVGKIASGSEHLYSEHLGIPLEHMLRCSQSNFKINIEDRTASYYFQQDNHGVFVEVQSQKLLLNAMRNNEHEVAAKEALISNCQSYADVFKALIAA
jgi:hypothetical protein